LTRARREEKDSAPRANGVAPHEPAQSDPGARDCQSNPWKDFTFLGGGKFGLVLKFLVMAVLVRL